jgi:hypothetical protein
LNKTHIILLLPLPVVVDHAKQDHHAVDQDTPVHVYYVWRWYSREEQEQERDAQEANGDDVDDNPDGPGNLEA